MAARIFVHDLCGHPFQVQLSKELAHRGHTVRHVYSADFQTGKGDLQVPSELDGRLEVIGALPDQPFEKYSVLRRISSEVRYGRAVAELARDFAPTVALTANDPLIAKLILARSLECRWVVWQQDLIFKAVENLDLGLPTARFAAAAGARGLERATLRRADAVVCIAPEFEPELVAIGVDPAKLVTIGNWAPVDEIRPMARPTAWQAEHGLAGRRLLVYAGTLGLKHNPELLATLAERLQAERFDADLVVVSSGAGADYLREQKARRRLDQLLLFDFQPYDRLPEVLAAAEGLIVLLEEAAGSMSVPSKVFSYLCAGRPILGSVPQRCVAHQQLEESGAAFLSEPDDPDGFVAAATRLLEAHDLDQRGAAGRRYAEDRFGISAIADRFEAVLGVAAVPADR